MNTTTEAKTCHTCLYMATHEKCDGCLHTKDDYKTYRETGKMPPYRYSNYQEGNWLKRVMEFRRDGKRNIVIGGQGEAEVNVNWTPQRTAKNLHNTACQCGYICGNLRHGDNKILLKISTHEGLWELEWDKVSRLRHIWQIDIDSEGNHSRGKAFWNWNDAELWNKQCPAIK